MSDRHHRGKPTRLQRILIPLIGGYGLGHNALILLAVPLRAHELGMSFGEIGLVIAAGSAAAAPASISIGAVVDRFGPRRCFLSSTLAGGAISLGFLAATGFWAFLALQVLTGLARTTAWVASQVYVTSFPAGRTRERLTARFSFWSSLSTMLTPLLGGAFVETLGTRGSLAFVAAFPVVFALAALPLPEPAPGGSTRAAPPLLRGLSRLIRQRRVGLSLTLTFVALWLSTVWTTFFPLLLVEQGAAPIVAATALTLRGAAATVTSQIADRLIRFGDVSVLTWLVLTAGTTGLALSPVTTAPAWLWLPSILIGIASGCSLPWLLLMISEDAPPGMHGLAVGLRMTVNQVSNVLSPVVAGGLVTAAGLGSGLVGTAVIAAVLLLYARRSL